MRQVAHLSDEELLLAADGELPWRKAARVRAHRIVCRACRARAYELETAMLEYARAYRSEPDPQVAQARAFWPVPAAALIVLAAIATFLWHYQSIALVREGAIPRKDLTPGAVRFIDRENACLLSDNVPGIPDTLKRQVLKEYGISEARADAYEIDFLITPALGGSESLRNLWPEPYFDTSWNARVKDALEDHFHAMVCSGKMDLPTAQREIAQNWIAAYRKYFHTKAPLATLSLLRAPELTYSCARQQRHLDKIVETADINVRATKASGHPMTNTWRSGFPPAPRAYTQNSSSCRASDCPPEPHTRGSRSPCTSS
jgi:hypothetical protein